MDAVARQCQSPDLAGIERLRYCRAVSATMVKLADIEDGMIPESCRPRRVRRRSGSGLFEQQVQLLRRAAANLLQASLAKLWFRGPKNLPSIEELRSQWSAGCCTPRKQEYFAWRQYPVPQCDWDNAHLIKAAINIPSDEIESKSGSSASGWRQSTDSKGKTRLTIVFRDGVYKTIVEFASVGWFGCCRHRRLHGSFGLVSSIEYKAVPRAAIARAPLLA